jgi:hypothetical protein
VHRLELTPDNLSGVGHYFAGSYQVVTSINGHKGAPKTCALSLAAIGPGGGMPPIGTIEPVDARTDTSLEQTLTFLPGQYRIVLVAGDPPVAPTCRDWTVVFTAS